jgi:hypothetical protein
MEECIHQKVLKFSQIFMEIFKLLENFEVIVKKIRINHKICSKSLNFLIVFVNGNEEQYYG